MGEGAYTQPNEQAVNLPRPVLNYIKDTAKKALRQVPDGSTPSLDFVDIKQRPSESYMKFIYRLKLTLDRQILQERAKEELLRKLAVSNANPECKKVLHSLPPETEPTLTQMIEACNFLGSPEHSVALQAQANGQRVAEALAAMKVIPSQGQ